MNYLKYIKCYAGLAAIVWMATGFFSCSSDFLKEEYIRGGLTTDYETTTGLDELSVGMYQNLEFHFNYEWSYTMYNYGTDEMAVGNDGSREQYNSYTSAFNSGSGDGVSNLWESMYSGISSANTLIANVPLYYDKNSINYDTRLGEGYFMRGFNYLRLVTQYGGVPLVTSNTPTTDFERSKPEDVYKLIIEDLKEAYNLLPDKPAQIGRITKWAAAHYIAKACLFRASEQNDAWNDPYKTQDLEDVIKYGKEVIAAHPLCADFVDLWNYTEPNGANEKVSEVVLAAQFSNDAASRGRYGNQIHLYYPSIYQTLAGLKRDISGDREFSRMRTTDYSLDIYDRVNDSRFWKSFITSYTCNNPTAAPRWDTVKVNNVVVWTPDPSLIEKQETVGGNLKTTYKPKFAGGEEAIRYIVNDANDTRYTSDNINYRASHMFVRYFTGEQKTYVGNHGNYGAYRTKAYFVALSKFRDGSRTSVADQFGCRDGILARSAEDYLMVAEALGRQGKYNDALPYINDLRKRAGYANGEIRNKHVDGGQAYKKNPAGHGSGTGFAAYSETNTYYESNSDMPETTAETKSALQFASVNDIFNSTHEFFDILGAVSEKDKFLVFIMNERSRELMGELHRWPDLARCMQLEKRFKAFNDGSTITGAGFDANKHYLRPIPQSFLDVVTKNGQPLTNDEKQAMQNHGY
jgi:hypothetical protein